MGWMNALTETYDNYFNGSEPECDARPLVPVGCIEKRISIRVRVNRNATFKSADVLKDDEMLCILSDPAAESRTGQISPYPLSDEMRYTAGDLSDFSNQNYSAYFDAYFNGIDNWCNTDDSVEELLILREYLRKRSLTSDILASGAIKKDKDGLFPSNYLKSFVDFCVYTDAEYTSLNKMKSVRLSWQNMLSHMMSNAGLCYSSGNIEPILASHAKIDGNAKLISTKDGPRPFQYKGRFENAAQACTVGYFASAKIHNTVKWLRSRQGYQRYGVSFITWSTDCRKIIAPQDAFDDEETVIIDTEEVYGKKIRNTMAGYMKSPEFKDNPTIVMLGLECATTGRMSIDFYEEFDGRTYLDNLSKWYEKCLWRIPVKKDDGSVGYYIKTPDIHTLSEAVFGVGNVKTADRDMKNEKSVTKQVRRFNQDILLCIVNARAVPEIYVNAAYHRACCPSGFINSKGKWRRDDWMKCVAVTLAMLKSSHYKEEYKLALNEMENCRDYLFGRLLAVADAVEMKASAGTEAQFRQTNAVKYFGAMQRHPAATWQTVRERIEPYFGKIKYKKAVDELRLLIDEITHLAEDGALSDNSPLTPRFLEGYHNQRYELLIKKEG